jgi:hypothetical protein
VCVCVCVCVCSVMLKMLNVILCCYAAHLCAHGNVHPRKAHEGLEGKQEGQEGKQGYTLFNLGARSGCVVNITPQLLYNPERNLVPPA